MSAGFKGHYACIGKKCQSSDALAISEDSEGLYYGKCFSCDEKFGHNKIARSYGDIFGIEPFKFDANGDVIEDDEEYYIEMAKKEPLTKEDREIIEGQSTFKAKGYRGIRDDIYKYFGVRHEYDGDGEVNKQLYPSLEKGVLVGYKTRIHPKDFSKPYGKFGTSSDLFGAFRFTDKKRDVIITGGEIDCISVFQVLKDHSDKTGKAKYGYQHVVSPLVGETGCEKQLQENYQFLDKYERIILAFDNDKKGKEAIDKIAMCLPKGKVWRINWSGKDPNQMLQDGQEDQILKDVWGAEKWTPTGIVGSSRLADAIREEIVIEKLPLPPFMSVMEEKMAGGIPLGYLINLASSSGSGKTTLTNEMIYYWIYNSPHYMGVLSLELDKGQYGMAMLSRHIGRKINLIKDPQEALELVNSPEVIEKEKNLFTKEDGSDRWMLIDDRDGDIHTIKKKVEELIISCGCKIIIIDPLTDILDGLSNEEQSVFMRWQKQVVKTYKVTFININHVRKSGGGEKATGAGKFLTEDDIQGSSSIYKSAGANILFTRDKYAEDEIEKNTTKVTMSKCRWTGATGASGEWYYDNETHTMYDKEYFFTHVKPMVSEEY